MKGSFPLALALFIIAVERVLYFILLYEILKFI